MRRSLAAALLVLFAAGSVQARGLLIPEEKQVPPLALLDHKVNVTIDDQVAVTRVEQTFRNHTDRQLEATYVFPVPKGASVRKFSMWVGGKEVPGELVEADKARKIYTDIVRRTQDPGLLEYMDHNLLKLRVFPIAPHSDQKIALSYTAVAPAEDGLVEYVYPLRTDARAVSTLEKFVLSVDLRSQHPIQNIYSPTHAITVTRPNDRQAVIGFEKEQALLDKDFVLYYTAGGKDVGLTALSHRPAAGANGYVLLLISPRSELSREQQIPRDMVFVLDTSGSMQGKRIEQARKALQYCLGNLTSRDRFCIMNFATAVNKYTDTLAPAEPERIDQARKWVDTLEATGGTAINDALAAALALRTSDAGRTFTIVFFTDGQPTVGETNIQRILANVAAKNTANTRIFTFGVGNDVNATFLDQLAERSRAVSTYVRESEDIEAKVSGLYAKISHPVLTDLKLTVGPGTKLTEIHPVTGTGAHLVRGPDVTLTEVYPAELPDLFHGTQLVVLARYSGWGHAAVKLTGNVGPEAKEFVYEVNFADKTVEDKSFVEDLWGRRKVGYLLDQIRRNGEKKELVDEVVSLAKRYGITTPYTSYLIVPDGPMPVVRQGGVNRPDVRFNLGGGGFGGSPAATPPALQAPAGATVAPTSVADFAKRAQTKASDGAKVRGAYAAQELEKASKLDAKGDRAILSLKDAEQRLHTYRLAEESLRRGLREQVQSGRVGVELSLDTNNLRNQSQLTQNAQRRIGNRNALDIGGVWIDEAYDAKMPTVTIKTLSPAYFRMLERHSKVREVFQLGNYVVWVTPSGTALVLDAGNGREEMPDEEMDRLFVARGN
jgi:Ca-activated chloride channel homolog